MIEVKEEVTTTKTVTKYQAIDGTIFTSEEECLKYEQSAKGVLRARLKQITVNDQYSHYDLMKGSDDVKIIAVKIQKQEDVDTVLQNILLDQPYLTRDTNKESLGRIKSTLDKALTTSDVIMLEEYSCDNNDLYLLDSRQNIIDKLMSLDKKEDDNV